MAGKRTHRSMNDGKKCCTDVKYVSTRLRGAEARMAGHVEYVSDNHDHTSNNARQIMAVRPPAVNHSISNRPGRRAVQIMNRSNMTLPMIPI